MVLEKTLVEPNVALELLQKQWGEIERCERTQVLHARSSRLGEGDEAPVRWVKPLFRTIKLNYDRAWHKETRRGGFDWVARDFAGIFKGAGRMGNVCCDSSLMAEAEAVLAALVVCVERGFGCVQIETDSKVLVDMLTGVIQSEAAMKSVPWDISHLKQQLNSVEFLFTPHSCNSDAHLVATRVTCVGACYMWNYFEPE